jgi:tRNA A37 threonylcarbamoyladenosine dehydratase
MSEPDSNCCATPSETPSLADNISEENRYRLHRRFDRLGRLYGDSSVERLMNTRVIVFGVGGVGSFAAEALVRSAIGFITLVDFDDVCVTNANRQLQALKGNIGKPKVWVLRDRLQLINPQANVIAKRAFYNAQRSTELLTPPWEGEQPYDFVVDCIDNMTAKAHLLNTCRELGLPVISSMGAAGKLDPTRIRNADLAFTQVDPMARGMRHILRKKYDFPKTGDMGITAIYSDEHRTWPKELNYDEGEGFRCVCPTKYTEHNCDSKNLIDGTASFVTGGFGLACAAHVITPLTEDLRLQSQEDRDPEGRQPKSKRPKPVRRAPQM